MTEVKMSNKDTANLVVFVLLAEGSGSVGLETGRQRQALRASCFI